MLKFAVVSAPLAILAVWGGSYVLDCLHALEAPGVPFSFTFETRSGPLTFVAQAYAVAPIRGSVHVWKPKLIDGSGKVLAQLDSLEATGLNVLRGADQIVRVRARNLQGKLTRFKNGQFDLQDYLPRNTSGASAIPYDVEIEGSRVDVLDLKGSAPWTGAARTKSVKVVGVGEDWVAASKVEIQGVGSIDARVQNIKGLGLEITGNTQSLEVAHVAGHIMETSGGSRLPQLARATCESLIVRGPFSVFIPKGKEPDVAATIDATARGIRYDKFTAAHASFVGGVSTQGMSGAVNVAEGDSVASFTGSAVWKDTLHFAGDLSASAPSSGSLPTWAAAFVPKGASFREGGFHGWISGESANAYHVSGEVEALSAVASNQRFDDLKLGVDVEKDHVVVQIRRAMCASGPLSGVLTIDPEHRTIQGYAAGQNLDLLNIGSQFGFKQVNGQASVSALVAGSFSQPKIEFETHGQGVANLPGKHTVSLGKFEAAGKFSNGTLQLDQAIFNTAYGLVIARGSLGDSGNVGLDVTGRGIRFVEYDPNFTGAANVKARVTGSLKNPVAVGRIEASDVAYKTNTIQAVEADFKVDRRHAEITDLQAARGTASLSGQGQVQFRSGQLSGSMNASDVQIAEWFDDQYAGAVDVPSVEISGTISHPIARGKLVGSSLVTKGVKLDRVAASINLDGDQVGVDGIDIAGAGGTLTGSANYDLSKRNGQVSLVAKDIDLKRMPLHRFVPQAESKTVVGGTASGTVVVSVEGGNLVDAKADGSLTALTVNNTNLGNGTWQAGWINRIFTGGVQVGSGDTHISLENAVFDPDAQRLKGELNVSNFPIQDLLDKAIPYFPDLSADVQDELSAWRGKLNLDCNFDETPSDPSVKVSALRIGDMTYRQEPLGDLEAKLDLGNHKWNIESLSLSKGPATFALKGTVDERGDLHIDASHDNRFDLSKLSRLDPRLSRLTGTAHLWVSADGPTKSPRIVASLGVDNLFAPPEISLPNEADDKYLRFELDQIVIDPSSKSTPGISVKGAYFYKGFRGTLSGTAPFEYPFTIPDQKPIDATVTFDKSNLKDIAGLVVGIDASKTVGSVDGSFTVQGTKEALAVSGGLNVVATSVKFTQLDDVINGVSAALTLAPGSLKFSAQGKSNLGGTLTAEAAVPVEDLTHLVAAVGKDGPASLLDRSLSGSIKTSDLEFAQALYEKSSVSGHATSSLQIDGTIRNPRIHGDVSLSSGNVVFNGLPAGTTRIETPLIDPTFDVDLRLNDQARLRSATADMYLTGGGTLKGTLKNPMVDATLTVEKGTVRLPASVLRLQEGGTVQVNYGIRSPGAASVVVDMEGNTSVTASRYGDLDVQRYDISLGMKGDLLQEGGLNLTASSDPGDLSQDRILGILGETDSLQTLSSQGKGDTVVQTALLSAVPTFLDPYTSQLAQGLGLDYINLEYNAFDQASVTFGKSIGSGLSIEGNRQLSEPPPGFEARYDLRILYHPRRLPGVFNQFRFYFGADQDNPWKVGVEYGVRF